MNVAIDSTRRESGRKPPVAPFAMLPHAVAADPRLAPVDVRVLLALVYFAKAKPTCYPGDAAIAARVGRSIPTIQRSLRRLQALGLIDRTGSARRVIVLCWRRGPAEMIIDDQASRSPMISPPRSPVISEGDKWEEEKRPSAAGREGPPPPSRTETAESPLPSPEEHARFLRDLAGRPRQDALVRLALANGQVTEAELADLAAPTAHVVPTPVATPTRDVAQGPEAPPDAGSPDPALAAPTPGTSDQADPTEVATRPIEVMPDRPSSADADVAGPGEARRLTAPVGHVGDPDPGRRTDSADARASGADGVAPRPSARRADQVRHPGDPPIACSARYSWTCW